MRTFISYDHVGDSRVDLATIVRAVSVPTVKLLTSPPVNFISRLTAQFRDINIPLTWHALRGLLHVSNGEGVCPSLSKFVSSLQQKISPKNYATDTVTGRYRAKAFVPADRTQL